MAITLDTLELPDDLAWPDRYAWQPVDVTVTYSLTGSAIVAPAEKLAGRPITLQSGDTRAWLTHAEVAAVKALQAVVDAEYSLTVRGETFDVVIQSVEATPLIDVSDDSDYCSVTIKMVTM